MFDEWLVAKHAQVPKAGDLTNPDQWRSISVLDALGSVLCSVMASRIRRWAKDNLPETQNGLRSGRGTLDAASTSSEKFGVGMPHTVLVPD